MAVATLTPSATTGKNVLFTASEAVFLKADIGRQIIFGASRAIIVSFGASAGSASPSAIVHADIIDAFPNTEPIPSGQWFLRLSPIANLTISAKGPVGTKVVVTADRPTFRGQNYGKYLLVYGGVIEIQSVSSTTVVFGEILSELQVDAITVSAGVESYPAAIGGTWTLEVSSWSPETGFPRTGEFIQGRLGQASTTAQPTTFWLSAPDSYDNYAVGIKANNALEYTIASKKINRIEWLADNIDMFLGTTGAELQVTSGKIAEPFGGDIVPKVNYNSNRGSAAIQCVLLDEKILFVDRARRQIFAIGYDYQIDRQTPTELTAIADHVTLGGLKFGPIAYQTRLDRRVYMVRNDGQIVVLTYFPNEKVIGFTRLVTDGFYEAVISVATTSSAADVVYVIVRRIINGVTKRYVEVFEDSLPGVTRPWASMQTDCGVFYNGVPTTTVSGLDHLEGETVDIVGDGGYRGTKVVSGGAVTLDDPFSQIEVGLHYDSTVTTMRPSIPNVITEGIPRNWIKIWARLFESYGGKLNNEQILYRPADLDALAGVFTGDRETTSQRGIDTEGRITFLQDQPYPFTLLALFGTINFGDHD